MFFEKVLKKAGWEVYSLDSIHDAEFRVPEFEPDVLILDTAAVAPHREKLSEWELGKAKILGLGFLAEKELWGEELHGFLEKPLEPEDLVDRILELI